MSPVLDPPGWAWIQPSTGKLFVWTNGEWVETDITTDSIKLSGSISTDGQEGLTGSRTIGGHKLTFKNGILVGYQAP